MWYIISAIKPGESIENCSFFIAKYYPKKFNKKDFKFDLLFDLTVYNAFYNHQIPDICIMADKEWNGWIKNYPQFSNSILIRNLGKLADQMDDYKNALSLNERLLTKEQISNIVEEMCGKYNL